MTKSQKPFSALLIESMRSSVRLMLVRKRLGWIRFKISWAFLMMRLSGHRKIYGRMNYISQQLDELGQVVKDSVEREKRLRIKGDKELEKGIRIINIQTSSDERVLNTQVKRLEEKIKHLDIRVMQNDQLIINKEFMEQLAANAEKKYNRFIADLNEFCITHDMTRRIASVETRITNIEILLGKLTVSKEQLHGSSTETSRTVGTHQN